MKKLFVALMALAVLGVQAFAASDEMTEKVTRKAAAAQEKIKSQQEYIKTVADVHADKTAAAMPGFLKGEYDASVRQEAFSVFETYFAANPAGEVQEAAYKPLAKLLASSIGLKRMIARATNVDDKENYAIQWFFSDDIPGKYSALKAVNPELAAATNNLMKSFIGTVSNGAFYGGPDHPDMKALREFKQDIGYKY